MSATCKPLILESLPCQSKNSKQPQDAELHLDEVLGDKLVNKCPVSYGCVVVDSEMAWGVPKITEFI